MSNCPFAKLLGERGKGVHKERLFGFALNDILGTIIGALLISLIFNYDFMKTLLYLFLLGEFLHFILGVDTAFLELINLRSDCAN